MSNDRFIMGVDPDCSTTAWAVLDAKEGKFTGLGVVRSEGGPLAQVATAHSNMDVLAAARFADRIVLEGQEARYGSTPNFQSIVGLAFAAGGFAALAPTKTEVAMPHRWTGGIPKVIRHRRLWAKLGLDPVNLKVNKDYARPIKRGGMPETVPWPKDVRASDWKHIGDAMGLALYYGESIR